MKRNMRALTVAITVGAVLVPAGIAVASHSHHQRHKAHWDHSTLWASPTGTGTTCTYAAPCTLTSALTNAASGATVRAKKGIYTGGVTIGTTVIGAAIATPLHLVGQRGAVINATGDTYGIAIVGSASGTTVRGFTVENASDTGIIAVPGTGTTAPAATPPVTHVTIADNVLRDNGTSVATPGWGIHLISATDSTVSNNRVTGNGGGVYLTDEFGPNDHNRVTGNRIWANTLQCGITLAGHVAAWNSSTLLPTGAGGVFDNLVANNVSNGNGTYVGSNTSDGDGAGILMGGGVLDAAVYGNVIRDNSATGNGLAGVVIHQHAPGDLNANIIVGNRIGTNNLLGDTAFTPTDTVTTGILVGSAAEPITGTVISRNTISKNAVGIWTLNVPAASNTIAHNRFATSVTTPVLAN